METPHEGYGTWLNYFRLAGEPEAWFVRHFRLSPKSLSKSLVCRLARQIDRTIGGCIRRIAEGKDPSGTHR